MSDEQTTDNTEQATSLDAILANPELLAQLRTKLAEDAPAEPDNEKVKANINKAYADRDELAKEVEQLRAGKREAELKALEEAGKKDEADQMRMQELKEQLKAAQTQVTGLTRDTALSTILASMDFTSEKAAKVAQQDIVGTLIQNAVGDWVSPNGQSISDYAKFYAADESNSFLFKTKQSSGSSSMSANTSSAPISASGKSVREMTVQESIAAASEGKLGTGKRWHD